MRLLGLALAAACLAPSFAKAEPAPAGAGAVSPAPAAAEAEVERVRKAAAAAAANAAPRVPLGVASAALLADAKAPAAPGAPSGTFVVLSSSARPPQHGVRLAWEPAEAGDYIVRGYRLWRSGDGGASWQRRLLEEGTDPEKAPPLDALSAFDPAETGREWLYQADAVDVKGKAGPRSGVGRVDLRSVPPALGAPRARAFLPPPARRESVSLGWAEASQWVSPVSAYRVHRAEAPEGLPAGVLATLSATAYEDSPPEQGRSYLYAVSALDAEGRVSALSLTISAGSTGPLPPGAPNALTARARTEKVSLQWAPAQPGTAPLSGYLLSRRAEGVDDWVQLAALTPNATAYTDSVDGDQGYLYRLQAVDTEGLAGPAALASASPSAKTWDKTLVVLAPTAYSNLRERDAGVNLGVLFDFYVGSLYESYVNPTTNLTRTGFFQPLQIGTVTGDLKWSLLDDRGIVPGFATGLYLAALIPFGNPGAGQSVQATSTGGNFTTLGNAYTVVSKRFWPGEPRAAVHLGMMYGKLADYLTSDPCPEGWRPTLRHLTPGGDIPLLFSRFVDPKVGAVVAQAPHLAFAGLQLPFTVPLLFTKWRTGLRLEVLTPLPDGAEFPANALVPQGWRPEDKLPVLTNIHLDNLPLFGFEFGLFQYPGGYQVIAFYHVPDLSWSW